jgi:hypothetical protein
MMNIMLQLKQKTSVITSVAIVGASVFMAPIAQALSTAALLPVSDGAYEQWTRVASGSTHYTAVDESSCNGTTDYIQETTVGERESFGVSLATVPNGATVTSIELTPCASRNANGNGSSVLDVFYRWEGVDSADAGAYALTGTTPTTLAATTWSGLSFTKSSSSTLQVGVEFASGNRGARVSRLAAVITYDPPAPPPTPPAAPSGLNAVNVSSSQNDLTWTDNSSNETTFHIERSANAQYGPFTQIATTTANVVAFSDTTVAADQTYYYRVRASNAAGYSLYTLTVSVITATVVPNAPLNLNAFASSTAASLTWTDNSVNEKAFHIERSTDGVNFSEIGTRNANSTLYGDPGLSPGTYTYRVRARNAIGYSDYSNTAEVTIP